MPTAKREEEDGSVKTPRRRTTTGLPDVTEAKPPASATAPVMPAQTMPVTETPRNAEEEIRRRAYELYEQDGRQDGRDHEHWLRAEAEIIGRSNERVSDRSSKRGQKSA